MDQIEQLGRALAMIFSKIQGFRNEGKVPESIEFTSLSLKTELDLDMDELYAIPVGEFVFRLIAEKKVNYTNLELLADILLHISDDLYSNEPENDQSMNFYYKCLNVYNYLNERDLTYSFERQAKIERISGIIN